MKKKEPTFEERLARLQAIVTTLETGDSPLEESVALYKEGLAHAAACREQLEKEKPNRIIDDLRQVEALVKEDLAWTYNMM